MQLPVHDPNHPPERSAVEVRSLALAIQANLTRLRDLDARSRDLDPAAHDIYVPSVNQAGLNAHLLIGDNELHALSCDDVHLRLHEVWGQFCLMCWLFGMAREPERADYAALDPSAEPHCRTAVEAKHAEVHALLWRIVFEQRRRHDADYVASPRFAEDQTVAAIIPAIAIGTPADDATDAQLTQAACEHAGMLATLSWLLDVRLKWGDPALTILADLPF